MDRQAETARVLKNQRFDAILFAMSKQELEEFLAAMERVRAANTVSPEMARQFLREEGLQTENGDLAEPYCSESHVLKP